MLLILIALPIILGSGVGEMKMIDMQPKKRATPPLNAIDSLAKDESDHHPVHLARRTHREKISRSRRSRLPSNSRASRRKTPTSSGMTTPKPTATKARPSGATGASS